jgi:hypothetical protein
MLYFNIQRARQHLVAVLASFQAAMHWSNERVIAERQKILDLMERLRPL